MLLVMSKSERVAEEPKERGRSVAVHQAKDQIYSKCLCHK